MKKVYIYLAERNKKGIKVLTVVNSQIEYQRTQITDVVKIGLPANLQEKIIEQAHKDRMLWDLYLESAEDFKSLKKLLTKRGYHTIPLFSSPMFAPEQAMVMTGEEAAKKSDLTLRPEIQKEKTMLRRMKEF